MDYGKHYKSYISTTSYFSKGTIRLFTLFSKRKSFFQSFGNVESEHIEFLIDGESWEAPDYSIISIEKAIECAQEFVQSPSIIPKAISWNAL